MGPVDEVRSKVDPGCLVRRIQKRRCTVSLKDAPGERLIVDFDKPGAPVPGDKPKCDYLFVAEGAAGEPVWVAPLELKSGALRASEAVRQLRAGAQAAETLVPGSLKPLFRPVAVCGSIHRLELAALRDKRNRILFHGRPEAVRLMTCGAPLAEVLVR